MGYDYPFPDIEFLKHAGGIFHDLLIHHVDQTNWLLNKDKVLHVFST